METLGLVLLVLFAGITLIALLIALDLLLPTLVERTRTEVETHPGKSFLIGLVNIVTLFAASALYSGWVFTAPPVVLDLIGMVLLIFIWVAIVVPGLPALAAIAQILGARMGEAKSPVLRDMRGGLLLILACLTPYVGWFLFAPAVLCTAIGSGLLVLFRRKNKAPLEKPAA